MDKLIFVYGSLKRGHWNNQVLGASEFVAEATTKGKYALTNCGFPYLIPEQALGGSGRHPTAPVAGEVYRVTREEDMASLDRLEGVRGGHYQHHNLVVVDAEGVEHEATAYVPCHTEGALGYRSCEMKDGVLVWTGRS